MKNLIWVAVLGFSLCGTAFAIDSGQWSGAGKVIFHSAHGHAFERHSHKVILHFHETPHDVNLSDEFLFDDGSNMTSQPVAAEVRGHELWFHGTHGITKVGTIDSSSAHAHIRENGYDLKWDVVVTGRKMHFEFQQHDSAGNLVEQIAELNR